MFFMLVLFLSASMFLDAAQQSNCKQKFDCSKLHALCKWFGYDKELTVEEYKTLCRRSKISFLTDALLCDDVAKIQDLVRDDVDVNAIIDVDEGLRNGYYKTDSTALHVVAQWGQVRAAREFLRAPTINVNSIGVFKNSSTNYYEYMTPLMLAISQAKVVVTQATKKNWCHLNAAEEYEKIVELLMQHGAIVTTVKYDDTSTEDALVFAIKHGTPRMVQMLLAAGANIQATYDGYSVLRNALDRQDHEILKLLLDYGVNVDEKIKTVAYGECRPINYLIFEHHIKEKKDVPNPSMIEELLFRDPNINDEVSSFKIALKGAGYTSEQIQQIFERVDKRIKEFIGQAEKILTPEFLLLDLTKIVSDYIAAPMALAKEKA